MDTQHKVSPRFEYNNVHNEYNIRYELWSDRVNALPVPRETTIPSFFTSSVRLCVAGGLRRVEKGEDLLHSWVKSLKVHLMEDQRRNNSNVLLIVRLPLLLRLCCTDGFLTWRPVSGCWPAALHPGSVPLVWSRWELHRWSGQHATRFVLRWKQRNKRENVRVGGAGMYFFAAVLLKIWIIIIIQVFILSFNLWGFQTVSDKI